MQVFPTKALPASCLHACGTSVYSSYAWFSSEGDLVLETQVNPHGGAPKGKTPMSQPHCREICIEIGAIQKELLKSRVWWIGSIPVIKACPQVWPCAEAGWMNELHAWDHSGSSRISQDLELAQKLWRSLQEACLITIQRCFWGIREGKEFMALDPKCALVTF